MRRLFIMRKDLQMSPGKLAAQVAHCAEAYWTRAFDEGARAFDEGWLVKVDGDKIVSEVSIPADVYFNYVRGSFVKTICEARNKNHLLKAVDKAKELGMVEDIDFGIIRDNCLTELEPEEEDGRTITGVWFKPLPDDVAHDISKKYQLYR